MRLFKFLRRGAIGFAGLTSLYLVTAFLLSVASLPVKAVSCSSPVTAYLWPSEVHADFVLPSAALSADLRRDMHLEADAPYVLIGLGDRDIFLSTPTWREIQPKHALKAMFWPTRRAIHVMPLFETYDGWVPVELCPDQLDRLQVYISGSFSRDASGASRLILGASYYGYDRFYEAGGTYTLLNSCNNWINGGIKAAGQRTSIWSPFVQGLLFHARRNGEKQPSK